MQYDALLSEIANRGTATSQAPGPSQAASPANGHTEAATHPAAPANAGGLPSGTIARLSWTDVWIVGAAWGFVSFAALILAILGGWTGEEEKRLEGGDHK